MNNEAHSISFDIAEAVAAWHEHDTLMLVGGHESKRLDAAMKRLEEWLRERNNPAIGRAA
jgi:hypothetical protein